MTTFNTITELEILIFARQRMEEKHDALERKIDKYAKAGQFNDKHIELCEEARKLWDQLLEVHERIVELKKGE